MQAAVHRRAVRRLVLGRATFLLELGLRRLARAAARERRRLVLLAVLLLMLTGPAPALHGAGARPRVFATLPDLFVLTRVVAGEAALLVRRADLLVRNGLEEDSSIGGRPDNVAFEANRQAFLPRRNT